jgi:hypothetical protein
MRALGTIGYPATATALAHYTAEHAAELGFPGQRLSRQSVNKILSGRARTTRAAPLLAAVYGVGGALFTDSPEGAALEQDLLATLAAAAPGDTQAAAAPRVERDEEGNPVLATAADRARFLRSAVYPASLGRAHTPVEVAARAALAGHALTPERIIQIEAGNPPAPAEIAALAAAYLQDAAFLTMSEPDALTAARRIEVVRLSADLGGYILSGRHLGESGEDLIAAVLGPLRELARRRPAPPGRRGE